MIGSWGAQGAASNTKTLRGALADKLGKKLNYVKGTDILSDGHQRICAGSGGSEECRSGDPGAG